MRVRSDHDGLALYARLVLAAALMVALAMALALPTNGARPGPAEMAFVIVFICALGALACVMLIWALLLPVGLAQKHSWLRGAARGDDSRAPLALSQPDPALAFRAGATLRLTSRLAQPQRVLRVLMALAFPLLLAVSVVGYIIAHERVLQVWLSDPAHWNILPPAPAVVWRGLLAGIAVPLVIGRWLLRAARATFWQTIQADDRGVTVWDGSGRADFAPWDDIRVFLRQSYLRPDELSGRYRLAGRRHLAFFTLYPASSPQRCAGGDQPYDAAARVLLATIATRGGVALRLPAVTAMALDRTWHTVIVHSLATAADSVSPSLAPVLPPVAPLTPTGNRLRAIIWGVVALVTGAGQYLLATYLSRGGWGAQPTPNWFSVLTPGLVVSAILAFVPLVYLTRERRIQAGWRGHGYRVQPGAAPTARPLQPGETLTLRRTGQSTAAILVASGTLYLCLPALLALLILTNTPAVYAQPEPPALWPIMALPLIIVVGAIAALAWYTVSLQSYTIAADDAGITLKRALRRAQRLAWGDIAVALRVATGDLPGGVFWLLGPERIARLDAAWPLPQATLPTTQGLPYAYSGGFANYMSDLDRLLVTIAARSHAAFRAQRNPLAQQSQTALGNQLSDVTILASLGGAAMPIAAALKQSFPLPSPDATPFTATVSGGGELPLAPEQPDAHAIAQAARITLPLVVADRVRWLALVGNLTLPALIMAGIMTWPIFTPSYFAAHSLALVLPKLAIAFGGCFLIFGSMALWSFWRNWQEGALTADDQGLVRYRLGREPLRLPWRAITTWLVVGRGPDGVRLVAATPERRIIWRVAPNGERDIPGGKTARQRAYQTQIAALHALIAQRTGLALRDISPRQGSSHAK